MAFMQNIKYDVQDVTSRATVANTPTARLMYYLSCVSTVLELDENEEMQTYKNYQRHYLMDKDDKNVILGLCVLFDPRILLNKVFFVNENTGQLDNQFFRLNQIKTSVAAVDSIVIGGVTNNVTHIMFFRMRWLQQNYLTPLEQLVEELRRPKTPEYQYQNGTSTNCTIL